MGIDIGFTEESLARSKYAHCARLRRQVGAVYSPPSKDSPDDLAQYRDKHSYLKLKLLRDQDPSFYDAVVKEAAPLFPPDEMRWGEDLKARFTESDVSRLEPYIEIRPASWIHLENVPPDMRKKLIARTGKEHRMSAWYERPYEERTEKYCKSCPIRPLDEDTCFIRFSNYPSMDTFRQGFMVALLYADTIDEEKLKDAMFSFPHLDRSKGELPKDKIAQLYEMVEGTQVNKKPIEFFNKVVGVLKALKPGDVEMDEATLTTRDIPFVDQFISAFVYRDEPYKPEDARKYLPYFETLLEVGDWAIWDASAPAMRHRLLNFKNRLDSLVTALKIADKYGIDTQMSY